MLPKKNRAGRREIEEIFQRGKFLNSQNLTFKFIKNVGKDTKISFIAPKSLAKSAVKRNFLRRRGYLALGKHFKHFPAGLEGAFIFKKPEEDISILENEIKGILSKIN